MKQLNTTHGIKILKKYNIEIPTPSHTIIYRHINDSLNNCYYIDFNSVFTNHNISMVETLGTTSYSLYYDSEYCGKVIESNYLSEILINSIIKSISIEFGKPHYDNHNGDTKTTKWEFDKLHILIHCNQEPNRPNGSISIYNPKILQKI